MTTDRHATEHIVATSTEESCHEVEDLSKMDRRLEIVDRLNAISDSVSFHSEFLKCLTEAILIDDAKDGTHVEKSETTEDDKSRRPEESSNIEEIKEDNSNEAMNKLGQLSDGNDAGDASQIRIPPDNHDRSFLLSASPGEGENNGTGSCSYTEIDSDRGEFTVTTKRKEKQLNVQYTYKFNLISMILLASRKLSNAKKTNEKVLQLMPDNFNALWNKVKLMVAMADESGDCIHERAEEILNQLEQIVSQNGKQMLTAKAEIATMYIDFLPTTGNSLIRCIKLYEEVLAETNLPNSKKYSEPMPEELVAFWKCHLIAAYAKLTNANKQLLAEYGYDHFGVLSRLMPLVGDVDSSDHIANKLKAQMWVNMANTIEHYKKNYNWQQLRQSMFYDELSLTDCFAEARAYDPDNAIILLRSGRELRQRSNSEPDLHKAIRLFREALNAQNIDNIRDVLYHHMGLAYRSLWLVTEHPLNDTTTDDAYNSTRTTHYLHPHLGCRVVKPPDHPLDFDLIPPPYKKPPKSAQYKILNPIALNSENSFLLEARKCFEEANRLVEDDDELSECLYLIEIARTYSSTANGEKAREYLLKAEKQPHSDIASVDFVGSSLYENLGFLEESEMMRKEFNEDDAEKAKGFYRESMRFSTISKQKPIVAFHYLLRILYKQLEMGVERHLSEMDQMILQNEYFLLYMAIQEAKDSREIVNFVARDDFRIALMWRLIEMFYRRNQQYDAAAAFTYLSILAVANKLTTEIKDFNLTSIEKQRMLLQVVERVTAHRVTQPRYLPEPYRNLYDLLVDGVVVDASHLENSLTDMEKKKLDIVMTIIQPDFSPGYTRTTEQCYLTL